MLLAHTQYFARRQLPRYDTDAFRRRKEWRCWPLNYTWRTWAAVSVLIPARVCYSLRSSVQQAVQNSDTRITVKQILCDPVKRAGRFWDRTSVSEETEMKRRRNADWLASLFQNLSIPMVSTVSGFVHRGLPTIHADKNSPLYTSPPHSCPVTSHDLFFPSHPDLRR